MTGHMTEIGRHFRFSIEIDVAPEALSVSNTQPPVIIKGIDLCRPIMAVSAGVVRGGGGCPRARAPRHETSTPPHKFSILLRKYARRIRQESNIAMAGVKIFFSGLHLPQRARAKIFFSPSSGLLHFPDGIFLVMVRDHHEARAMGRPA
jgi:hypothetical protein